MPGRAPGGSPCHRSITRCRQTSGLPSFLSAGIDSTSVVALARESGVTDLQTMTLRFEEYRGRVNDEAPLAAMVARQYGVPHTIRDLTLDEFKGELPRIFEAMDQPSVNGLNSYFISKAAAGMGLKVALSGTGGDDTTNYLPCHSAGLFSTNAFMPSFWSSVLNRK